MRVLWKLVCSFVLSLLRRGVAEQNAIASAADMQEGIIEGLRAENKTLTQRCDMLQRNYDQFARELAELRLALGLLQLESQGKDRRIAELESQVKELQSHG
jgi:predicted RNase H-like nuclease (RuvC/YqgF family)